MGTAISADIVADTTWSENESPFELSGCCGVLPGVTLTIEAGVHIKAGNGGLLRVDGTLDARGTTDAPVVLDGTDGGDGPAWGGVVVSGGSADLSRATIDHATDADRGSLCADNGGRLSLTDVNIQNGGGYAIQCASLADAPRISRLTAIGNTRDAVGIGGGTVTGVTTLQRTDVPYVIGQFSVALAAELVIEPGALLVDVSFEYADIGIGLEFGPIGQLHDIPLAPDESTTVSVPWTPPVQGSCCIQARYNTRQQT